MADVETAGFISRGAVNLNAPALPRPHEYGQLGDGTTGLIRPQRAHQFGRALNQERKADRSWDEDD
jgi:hypothetical protein